MLRKDCTVRRCAWYYLMVWSCIYEVPFKVSTIDECKNASIPRLSCVTLSGTPHMDLYNMSQSCDSHKSFFNFWIIQVKYTVICIQILAVNLNVYLQYFLIRGLKEFTALKYMCRLWEMQNNLNILPHYVFAKISFSIQHASEPKIYILICTVYTYDGLGWPFPWESHTQNCWCSIFVGNRKRTILTC